MVNCVVIAVELLRTHSGVEEKQRNAPVSTANIILLQFPLFRSKPAESGNLSDSAAALIIITPSVMPNSTY